MPDLPADVPPTPDPVMNPMRLARISVGGVLMGIANLIPGVSGGTMILAVGLYEAFIDAVADISAFRWRWPPILLLGVLGFFALGSIVALSGLILHLLLWHSAAMFALFIGLTLGGVPLLLGMIGRWRGTAVAAAVTGLGVMLGISLLQRGASLPHHTVMDFVSGVVGSTTMVLPGISGSYMLLVLGQYDRVVGAVSDLRVEPAVALRVLVPVGIGAVLGIVALSNLLKFLLHRYEKVTLAFLLGILLGSVFGLWPFDRQPTAKILEQAGDAGCRAFAAREGIAGCDDLQTEALYEHIRVGWSARGARPYASRTVATAGGALLLGLAVTTGLGRLGRSERRQGRKPARLSENS